MSGTVDPLDPPKVDATTTAYRSKTASIEKFVDSRLFITFARVVMIGAGAIGLPVAGWLMTRIVNSADEIVTQVRDTSYEVRTLKGEFKNGFEKSQLDINRNVEWLKDHEGRIRVLERVTPLPTRPN